MKKTDHLLAWYAAYLVLPISISLFAALLLYVNSVYDLAIYRIFLHKASWRVFFQLPFILFIILGLLVAILLIVSDTLFRNNTFRSKINVIRGIIFFLLLFALALCLFLTVNLFRKQSNVLAMRERIEKERTVVHAGGYITSSDGTVFSYTNSFDALSNCYAVGNRICELDFIPTSDDYLVCLHDGNDGMWGHGLDFESPPLLEEFMQAKIMNEFQTMSLNTLADFMRTHDDLLIVTDIKSDRIYNSDACAMIKKTCPDLMDRFIIQIYNEREYHDVAALGFQYIIYTLYASDDISAEALRHAALHHDLVGLTFWSRWVDLPEFFYGAYYTGIPMYVHTVNEPDEMELRLSQGISAIYTDLTDNDTIRRF